MKHLNDLLRYGICIWLYCCVVIASTQNYCQPPHVPAEGKCTPVKDNFFPGDELSCFCKQGFVLIGEATRKCKLNGTWSAKTPFCDRSVKLKNPWLSSTTSHDDIYKINDGSTYTYFLWSTCPECYLQLYLHKVFIVQAVKILLETGYFKIQILTGLESNMTVCDDYDRYIEKEQWIVIKCKSNGVLADRIKIVQKSNRNININIYEIQAYVADEDSCDHPPEMTVTNGYFEVSRNKADLLCKDGYKSQNSKLVCEGNSWKDFRPKCEETNRQMNTERYTKGVDWKKEINRQITTEAYTEGVGWKKETNRQMTTEAYTEGVDWKKEVKNNTAFFKNPCDSYPLNSTSPTNGKWVILDGDKNLTTGTRLQLKCNTGYEMIGIPDIVTCQKSRTWNGTHATCIEIRSKEVKNNTVSFIIGAVGAVVVIVMLILLGIFIHLKRKRGKRENAMILTNQLIEVNHLG